MSQPVMVAFYARVSRDQAWTGVEPATTQID